MTAQNPDTSLVASVHPVGPNPVVAAIPLVSQQGTVTAVQGVPVTLRPAPRAADDMADPRRRPTPVTVTHLDAATPANVTMASQLRMPGDPTAVNRTPFHTAPTSALPVRPRTLGDTVVSQGPGAA